MPWVRFESRDGVRIALAAGAIPTSVAARPVDVLRDGEAVILPADDLSQREAIKRLGGRFFQVVEASLISNTLPNWFAIVTCVPADDDESVGPFLIVGPAPELSQWWPGRAGVCRVIVVGDRAIVECERRPRTAPIVFHRVAPGNWVRLGWQHRLAAILPPRPDDDLLFDPAGVTVADDWHDATASRDLDLPSTHRDGDATLSIPVTIRPTTTIVGSLVRIDDPGAFAAWLARLGPTLRSRIPIARLTHDGESMSIVLAIGRPIPGGVPLGDPAGLLPSLRADVRRRALGESPDRVTWIDGGAVHQAMASAFRSAEVRLAVRPKSLVSDMRMSPFAFEPFATVRAVEESEPAAGTVEAEAPASPRVRSSSGWLDRVFGVWRPKSLPIDERSTATDEGPTIREVPDRAPLDLERSLMADYGVMSAKQRCRAWAELAEVNARRRDLAEASRAWLNAIWEHPEPPAEWYTAWGAVERDPQMKAAIRAIAGGSGDVVMGDEWPVRLIWLTALARRDPLHLARTHDQLQAAMADGFALDRDAPAFLRRAGGAEGEAVRDWVRRNRENAGRWIGRALAGSGRLQRVGLDADPRTTAAYADLIAAKAAERCGEGRRARAWRAEAEATLAREPAEHRSVHEALIRRVASGKASRVNETWSPIAAFAVRQFESVFGDADPGSRFVGQPSESAMESIAMIAAWKERGKIDAIESLARSRPATTIDRRLALGAAAWLAAGRIDRGLSWLDACRDQLFAAERFAPPDQTALAISTARALAFAPPRIARGRLEELFHRLEGIGTTGSTNRYYSRQPLTIVAAAYASAVPTVADETATALANWLAEDERIVRKRMAADCG